MIIDLDNLTPAQAASLADYIADFDDVDGARADWLGDTFVRCDACHSHFEADEIGDDGLCEDCQREVWAEEAHVRFYRGASI